MRIGSVCWEKLDLHLEHAHLWPDAPQRAAAVTLGWMEAQGPTWGHEDRNGVVQRVLHDGGQLGFDELPPAAELLSRWERAHERWLALLEHEETTAGKPLDLPPISEGVLDAVPDASIF